MHAALVAANVSDQQLHVAHVGGGGGGGGAGGGGAGGGGAGGGGGGGAEHVVSVRNIDAGHVPTDGVPTKDIDIDEHVLLSAEYVAVACV